MILDCKYGSFHLLSLVAAGEMLLPFNRKKRDDEEGRLGSSFVAGSHIGTCGGSSSVVEDKFAAGAGLLLVLGAVEAEH